MIFFFLLSASIVKPVNILTQQFWLHVVHGLQNQNSTAYGSWLHEVKTALLKSLPIIYLLQLGHFVV